MTKANPSDIELIALEHPCAYCGADHRQWCITNDGKPATTWLHQTRMVPVREAFALGYQEFEDWIANCEYAQLIRTWERLRKRRQS